jgi:hypothetical protein
MGTDLVFLNSSFSLPKMSAYVIVEIDVLDPAGYEEYKKLAGATVENMAENTSCVAVELKCSKGIGDQSASLSFNSNRCSEPGSG